MPADLPNRATNGSRGANAYNKLLEATGSHRPSGAPGVRTSHTAHGTFHEAENQPPYAAEPTAVSSPIGYRGQWTATPPSPYQQNDIVILLTGANSGTYLNLTDNNTSNPALGLGWVQIAPGDAFGRWS